MARLRIGDLLVRAGLIDELQLQSVLAHQRQWGGRLGDILVEQGFLDEMMLWRGLSRQLSLPLVSLADWTPVKEVLAALPYQLARSHTVFPMSLEGQKLTLATSDPGDMKSLDELGFRTAKSIRTVLAPPREIDWAIERFYRNVMSPCPPPRVKSRAVDMPVEEMQVVHRGGAGGPSLGRAVSTPSLEIAPTRPAAPAPAPAAGPLAQVKGGSATSIAEDTLARSDALLAFAVEICVHRGLVSREDFAARLAAKERDDVFSSPSAAHRS